MINDCSQGHVGILDNYILFSDNVIIRTIKCLFETNNESEHHPPNQPLILRVRLPPLHSQPTPTNHSLTQPITYSPQEVTTTYTPPPTKPSNLYQFHPAHHPPTNLSPPPSPSQSLLRYFTNPATDSITSSPSHSSTHSFFTSLTQPFLCPSIRQHTRSLPHSPPPIYPPNHALLH